MAESVRIAMWSGPRNISTALMRSFGARADTWVADEPFYAAYLAISGADHPMVAETLASQPNDWRDVVPQLLAAPPGGRSVFYQKHMTHHMLRHIGHDWFGQLSHAFLIRDPRAVLLSYIKSRPDAEVTADDIGVPQQAALYDEIAARAATPPPVIDSDGFLKAPEAHLRSLCERLGIPFTDRMLHWPAGPRASDGIWAPHWYAAVLKSTGFEPWCERDLRVPERYRKVIDACMVDYERLHRHRIVVTR